MWHMRGHLSATRALLFALAMLGLSPRGWSQGQPITFSATGDIPYGASEVLKLQQQIINHNKYSPSAFFVHVGDIFGGGEPCEESLYSSVAGILKGLTAPAFIIPGDNETIDCISPSQGLSTWKKIFLNFEQNFCGAPNAERQGARPENFAFTMDGVLFIGINMVGGSSPYQQNADWISQQFQTKDSQVRAAVVFSHVGPDRNSVFSVAFRQAAAAFGRPVLFLHGHGHSWVINYPFPEANILRVQVDNGAGEDPVEVTVTLDTSTPATAFMLKRYPWSSKTIVNMPPCVNAGPDQTLGASVSTATLQGQVSDDGDPNGVVTTTWSKVSGPDVVTFGNLNALTTTASFSAPGTYVLRLTADDGQLQKSDEVTIVSGGSNSAYLLSANTTGSGSVSLNPPGGVYNSGTVVTVTASPAAGFQFSGWSGHLTGSTNPATITMNANKSVTATFTAVSPSQFMLTTSTAGSGSVSLNPPGGVYNSGTVVTLTASPATGFQFSGWSGTLSGSTNPATISMNANKSVAATFTATGANSNANLAKGKSVTASSTYSGKPAENAVDGSASTYWRSGSVSSNPIAWLRVDLGASMTIGRAIVRWKESYYAKSYDLQVSNDEASWTTVYTTTAGTNGFQQFAFTPVTARYVRLYMKRNNKSNYQIFELEVYAGSVAKSADEVAELLQIPDEVLLEQNYPNPFNPATSILYSLPEGMLITLKVYNLAGQEVATLVEAHQEAGRHEVIFDAARLPSGNYIAVLQAGKERRIRQIVLMK